MSQKKHYQWNRRLFCISGCILLTFIAVIGLLGEESYAADQTGIVVECNEVPSVMAPGTILIFDTTSTATMIQGGLPAADTPPAVEPVQEQTIPNSICFWEPPPKIYPGMKVVYNEYSGLIDNILYPDSNEPSGYSIHNFPEEELARQAQIIQEMQEGILHGPVKPEPNITWKWGASNNVLTYYSQDDLFYGTGRATYFNDRVGNRDNQLGPYDLATKQLYDSSKRGDKVVTVRNMTSGATYTYHQADVGNMKDAIIDIWGLDNIHELAESNTATSAYNVSYSHFRFSDQDMTAWTGKSLQ